MDVEFSLRTRQTTYVMLREFPAGLKLYDRVLDITPNDVDVMAAKATIYQAQGNLQEAATFLSEINQQTPTGLCFLNRKLTELRLQRNYGEAIRLLQVRQDQFHFASLVRTRASSRCCLALMQRLAGDTAGATATAQQVRNTLEPLHRDQPDNLVGCATSVSSVCRDGREGLGSKDSGTGGRALPECQRSGWTDPV